MEKSSNKKFFYQKKKYRWTDLKTGYNLCGGGIIFYDDNGIWTIAELNKNEVEFNDIGGKYNMEDGDIWATISRELGEESYHTLSLTRADIKAISKESIKAYMCDQNRSPIYLCLLVHVSVANKYRIVLDSQKTQQFLRRRQKTIRQNPQVPEEWYTSLCLCYLKYTDLADENTLLSYRLRTILRYCRELRPKLPPAIYERRSENGPIKFKRHPSLSQYRNVENVQII